MCNSEGFKRDLVIRHITRKVHASNLLQNTLMFCAVLFDLSFFYFYYLSAHQIFKTINTANSNRIVMA